MPSKTREGSIGKTRSCTKRGQRKGASGSIVIPLSALSPKYWNGTGTLAGNVAAALRRMGLSCTYTTSTSTERTTEKRTSLRSAPTAIGVSKNITRTKGSTHER